jgi:hypothetical protein
MPYELIQVFEEQSAELYTLAYLLTANTDRGIEAFSRALDLGEPENPAFGGFMNSWARKLVAVEALGTMAVELRTSKERVARMSEEETSSGGKWKRRPYISKEEFEDAVIAIDAFPRCAMLLTIFEGMSVQAASLLLNADKSIVRKAQRIGIVQLTRNLAGDRGPDPYREAGRNPVPVLSLG